jgi:drug/metabolite transporter (DMT)-like permease
MPWAVSASSARSIGIAAEAREANGEGELIAARFMPDHGCPRNHAEGFHRPPCDKSGRRRTERMSGPAWMLLGIALFAVLDLNTKWLSAGYGMGQVLLLRYLVMLLVLLPFLGRPTLRAQLGLHLLRGVLMLFASMTFFYAFAELPLFDGYIVFYTAPFILMALGRFVLDERVPPAAWVWAMVGFAGVIIALVPRATQEAGRALWPLLAAFGGTLAYVLVLILTRRVAHQPVAALLLWPAVLGTLGSAPLALVNWTPPGLIDLGLLCGNGVLWAGAIGAISRAVQLAAPSRLAPLDFTSAVWVIAFDRFIFGHAAGGFELVGATVVIGACVMHARVMAREQAGS